MILLLLAFWLRMPETLNSIRTVLYHSSGLSSERPFYSLSAYGPQRNLKDAYAEAGFTDIGLIQVPPEGGVAPVVRHAEDHPFHLAV